jgi:hypothetical protein
MISPSYDFEVFTKAVRNKDYLDTIYSAEQEATEAERFYYRHRNTNDVMIQECKQYADALKHLLLI